MEINRYVKLLILIFFLTNGCQRKESVEVQKKPVITGNEVKVALLQLNPVGSDVSGNLKKGEDYIRKAKMMDADIVLFPEMWSIGYSRYNLPGTSYTPDKYPLSFEEWKSKELDAESEFIKHFQSLARELDMAIIITYLEKWDNLPRNSATVIDHNGNLLMTYAKVHTSDMKATESNCTPGDDFYVCSLPVREDTVCLGIMTCFDREFPESARILMLKGAELILTPNACTLEEKRINQFQSRAYENAVAVAMTNYASPSQNGHSCAFDVNGDKLFVADEGEGIFIVSFDMGKIREYRSRTSWGNAFRRPTKYGLINSTDVDSVFIRNNGLGVKFDRVKR